MAAPPTKNRIHQRSLSASSAQQESQQKKQPDSSNISSVDYFNH